MYDFMLTPEEQAVKKEARDFVNTQVSSRFLREMDKDEIVYPRDFVEQVARKNLRAIRLSMIWTRTSQIMNLLIQHEYYSQVLSPSYDRRKMEKDAMNPDESERCFTDEDMWNVHTAGTE